MTCFGADWVFFPSPGEFSGCFPAESQVIVPFGEFSRCFPAGFRLFAKQRHTHMPHNAL